MRGETIKGTRPAPPNGRDGNGNVTRAARVPFTIKRCLLAPSGSSNSGSSDTAEPFGTYAITQVQVIVLGSVPVVGSDDLLEFWGSKWQADGLVGPWRKGKLFGSVFMVNKAS